MIKFVMIVLGFALVATQSLANDGKVVDKKITPDAESVAKQKKRDTNAECENVLKQSKKTLSMSGCGKLVFKSKTKDGSSIAITSEGAGNSTSVQANGAGNKIVTKQSGNGNTVVIRQSGSGNKVNVVQKTASADVSNNKIKVDLLGNDEFKKN